MALVDPADLQVALGGQTVPADVLLQASDEATTEVVGRLRPRFGVLPDPAPQIVRGIARDIAVYLATLVLRHGDPLMPGEAQVLRWQYAENLLGRLVNGEISLDIGTAHLPEAAEAAVVNPYVGVLFPPDGFGLVYGSRGLGREYPQPGQTQVVYQR